MKEIEFQHMVAILTIVYKGRSETARTYLSDLSSEERAEWEWLLTTFLTLLRES